MKTLKYFLVALFVVSSVVAGQVPASADAEQRAAVKELLDAMNFKQMMSQISGPMMQQIRQLTDDMVEKSSSKGSLAPEQVNDLRNTARESSAKSFKAMTDLYNDPQFVESFEGIMARAYARNFTLDEIKATTAFYVSPAGKKTLTVMPKMMQETMPEMMAIIAPRMSAIMESTTKDVAAQIEKVSKAASAKPAK